MREKEIKDLKRSIGCTCSSWTYQTITKQLGCSEAGCYYKRTTSCPNCDAFMVESDFISNEDLTKRDPKETQPKKSKPKKKINMRKIKLYIGLMLGVMTIFISKGGDILQGMSFGESMFLLFISAFFVVTPPFLIIDVIAEKMKEDF